MCIEINGKEVSKGECSHSGALGWGLLDGKLTARSGSMCLVRKQDNSVAMASCQEANEFVTMDIPTFYSNEDLAKLVKNQDKLTPEERAALAEVLKKQGAL